MITIYFMVSNIKITTYLFVFSVLFHFDRFLNMQITRLVIFTVVLLRNSFYFPNVTHFCLVRNKPLICFMYIFTWLDEFPAAIFKAHFTNAFIRTIFNQIFCSIDSYSFHILVFLIRLFSFCLVRFDYTW